MWFASCQNASENKKVAPVSAENLATEISKSLPTASGEKEHPGKAVYAQYCLSCHQADGSGVPGMHPPLTPGSWVGNDSKELIAIMMKGLSGKIEVNGEVYKNFMPSHAQLTDEQLADVLSYVRSSFGNNFDPVTPEMVKKVRSGK
ncbi:cytochrome c family protein [Aquipluma nitroreducens]|uniref:Cytochrome c family protein n=1 Tax=Aquipluma nitroreducens TaxID=2010828 RepID=A0A5K7S344_9BACT|nr:cytochrome c family protein [Aquipluma nitroreducens]